MTNLGSMLTLRSHSMTNLGSLHLFLIRTIDQVIVMRSLTRVIKGIGKNRGHISWHHLNVNGKTRTFYGRGISPHEYSELVQLSISDKLESGFG